ncbi:MAG: hypothetical protein WCG26_02195 [Chloroflexales bacterium]
MGTLALPTSGLVYLDTDALIYSVEKIAPYDEGRACARPSSLSLVTGP